MDAPGMSAVGTRRLLVAEAVVSLLKSVKLSHDIQPKEPISILISFQGSKKAESVSIAKVSVFKKNCQNFA